MSRKGRKVEEAVQRQEAVVRQPHEALNGRIDRIRSLFEFALCARETDRLCRLTPLSLFRISSYLFCFTIFTFPFALSQKVKAEELNYTLTFVARPPQLPTPERAASLMGHAYIIIGHKTNLGIKEDVLGFYPAKNGLGIIKGPGMLKAEYRCGNAEGCTAANLRELRTRIAASNSASITITDSQRRALFEEINKWNGKSAKPDAVGEGSEQEYRLLNQNCIDFVSAVVHRLGYPAPARSSLQTPTEYIASLRTAIEQESQRRAIEEQMRRTEERVQQAETRARDAEERAANAESRERRASEAKARAGEQRDTLNAEANRIPSGWVLCGCPTKHSSRGKWVNGKLYHPLGIYCQ